MTSILRHQPLQKLNWIPVVYPLGCVTPRQLPKTLRRSTSKEGIIQSAQKSSWEFTVSHTHTSKNTTRKSSALIRVVCHLHREQSSGICDIKKKKNIGVYDCKSTAAAFKFTAFTVRVQLLFTVAPNCLLSTLGFHLSSNWHMINPFLLSQCTSLNQATALK